VDGFERERDCGTGADGRDVIVRAVLFACASLAAWWCCSNVASADEAQSAVDHSAIETAGPADPSAVEPEVVVPAVPAELTAPVTGASESVDPAGPAAGPALFPVVVVPLVDAVAPAVAPSGDAVLPVADAVTTPAAPVLGSVVPVADRIVGPVVAPAAGPAVEVVGPVVEGVAASAAPVVGLVAPVVDPVVRPVMGVVAPVVGGVVSSVADPLAGVTGPALRSVLDDPGSRGLRPSTADFPVDLDPVGDVLQLDAPFAVVPVPFEGSPGAGAASDGDEGDAGDIGPEDVSVLPAAAAVPAPVPAPAGGPFRGSFPSQRAVVLSQGSPDSSQRSQRWLAVFSPTAGPPEMQTTALGRVPVESPLARFGGRAPVTPD